MPRYAIYYCPAQTSSLWQFGSAVLGYDSSRAVTVPYPETELVTAEQFASWAERPGRYGFHATLKAPFHLRPGISEAELKEHVRELSTTLSRVALGHLDVTSIGAFVALTAASPNPELSRLASKCVDHLEPIADVGLVASLFLHGFAIGNPGEHVSRQLLVGQLT